MAVLFALLVSLPLIDLRVGCIALVTGFVDATAADVGCHDCTCLSLDVVV